MLNDIYKDMRDELHEVEVVLGIYLWVYLVIVIHFSSLIMEHVEHRVLALVYVSECLLDQFVV